MSKPTKTKTPRKTYDDQFKRDAVKLLSQPGYTLAKAPDALGVSQATLSNWKKTLLPKAQAELAAENARLQKRLKEVEMQRDILNKLPGERPPTSRRRADEIRLHPRAARTRRQRLAGAYDVPSTQSQPQRVL